MQHNNKENGRGALVRRFFAEKGYYFVLVACVAAIGASGWLLYTSLRQGSDTSAILSAPTMAGTKVEPSAQEPQADDPEQARTEVHPSRDNEESEAPANPTKTAEEEAAETASRIVVWPLNGQTLQSYAMDHLTFHVTTQDWRTHDGIDLAAAEGTPVMAASAGTVARVYQDDLLGTVVELTHADGYRSCYANLGEMPTVAEGDSVAAGDILGAVGTTAAIECAEEAHLHFSVSRNGASVDPGEWLP